MPGFRAIDSPLYGSHSIKGDITDEQFDWWNESGAKKLCIEKRRDAATAARAAAKTTKAAPPKTGSAPLSRSTSANASSSNLNQPGSSRANGSAPKS